MNDEDFVRSHGYVTIVREDFLAAAAIPGLAENDLKALQDRANGIAGSHVLYDPYDNGDGWLLVGPLAEITQTTRDDIEAHHS